MSDEQYSKAFPILVTPSPISILVSDEQPPKASTPMFVTPPSITTLVKERQAAKAPYSILVTLVKILWGIYEYLYSVF